MILSQVFHDMCNKTLETYFKCTLSSPDMQKQSFTSSYCYI